MSNYDELLKTMYRAKDEYLSAKIRARKENDMTIMEPYKRLYEAAQMAVTTEEQRIMRNRENDTPPFLVAHPYKSEVFEGYHALGYVIIEDNVLTKADCVGFNWATSYFRDVRSDRIYRTLIVGHESYRCGVLQGVFGRYSPIITLPKETHSWQALLKMAKATGVEFDDLEDGLTKTIIYRCIIAYSQWSKSQ